MRYSTDLTDKQWAVVCELLKKENRGKHLKKHTKREFINAVLYIRERRKYVNGQIFELIISQSRRI